ncbi:major royal jelly protein 5 [Apis cerana]|uniref:Major royal jelly protein 9 n=1 Tax=Apis cerana TaxID=7461 RepID=V9IHW6_APICE|nr:major royal jelly protein 5 [Apis cerana]
MSFNIWWLILYFGIVCQTITKAHYYSRHFKANALKVVYQWKYFDYNFGSNERRQAAIQSGKYNYKNNFPIDVDRWHDKTFVTILRNNGVPSSLNVISNKIGNGGPLLEPYPNWSWAENQNCSGITSVYRVAIDVWDRLWVLDNGISGQTSVCSSQIVVFDLKTSKLLKQVKIPHNIAVNSTTGNRNVVTPIVQSFDYNNTLVYIADVEGYALIIYNNADDSFQRLTSSTFVYDPRYTNYTINEESFTLQDGILGMALSRKTQNLYYSAMSSHNLNYVNTKQFTQGKYQANNIQYQGASDILWTQATAKAISKTGALFFGLVTDTALGCWNENRPLKRGNIEIVAKNNDTLQFISGLKISKEISSHIFGYQNNEYIWALSNKYQKIANGDLNFNEVNFRILTAPVNQLISHTRCENPNTNFFSIH